MVATTPRALRLSPLTPQSFFLNELGTTGSVDGADRMLMKGKYQRLQKGEGSAEALRAAKLAMIKDGYAQKKMAPR